MDDVTIRPAALDELNRAGELRALMAREEGVNWDAEHPRWHERFAEFFAEKQRCGRAQVYYAQRGDEIVGMAAFSLVDEYRVAALGQPRGWVNSVFVLPHLRRRGIARALMQIGMKWLHERGCVMVRLRTSEEGRALYRSLGFVAGKEMELKL
ncbi:MAG TPA: GNAT family N-acetyltransferase [Candidatus Baltobacteraceae bacterium]|nr:GNAT family N-acetyltransferase [Candidatus Baltobacteraceae bacterium]